MIVKNILQPIEGFIFCVLLLCITPFLYSNSFIDQDLIPKGFAVSLIAALFSIYLFVHRKKIVLKFNKTEFIILWMIVAFLALFALGIFKSINPGDAIYDSLRFSLIFIFSILTFLLIKSEKLKIEQVSFFSMIAVCILLSFFYGQLISGNSGKSLSEIKINYELSGNMGNKNYLAEALTILCPFVLLNFLFKRKWAGLVIGLLLIISIIILRSTSAYIALFILMATVFLILFLKRRNISDEVFRKYILWLRNGIITLSLLAIAVFFLKTSLRDKVNENLEKTTALLNTNFEEAIYREDSANVNSMYERLLLWHNSKKLFEDHWVTGCGNSNWKLLMYQYGIGGAPNLNHGPMHYEHPHNEYLLLPSEHGIFLTLLYLTIFLMVFIQILKRIKHENSIHNLIQQSLFAGGILALLTVSFFAYPLYRPFTSSCAGMLLAFSFAESNSAKSSGVLKSILSFTLIFLSIFSAYVIAVRGPSEILMAKALASQKQNHFDRMSKLVKQANSYFYPLDNTSTPLNWYAGFSDYYSGKTDSAIFYFEKAISQHPYHAEALSDYGACLENLGKHEEAIKIFDRSIQCLPNIYSARKNKAVSLYNLNRKDEALKIISSFKIYDSQYHTIFFTLLDEKVKADTSITNHSDLMKEYNRITFNKPYFIDIYLGLKDRDLYTDSVRSTLKIRLQQ